MDSPYRSSVECRKILLIEDDEGFAMLYERFLKSTESRQYILERAATAEAGIKACLAETFDCLVVDYHLPDASGAAMMKALRAELGDEMPPAIVLTASQGGEPAIESLRARAEDFLPKRSLGAIALNNAIDNAISKAELKKAVRERNEKLENAYYDLQKKTEELTRFYHTVSHEVKTPLTAIGEFVALIKDGIPGPVNEEQITILNYTQECCEQISRHFSDLLDVTRLETGKLVLHKKPQSLAYIVMRCVEGSQGLARDRQIDLIAHCAEQLPDINIDGGRISQIIFNLISNAIKFTDKNGKIRVDLDYESENSKYLVVKVADNGCGIGEDDIGRVFDRLYQVEFGGKDSAKSEGLGLGLSIALDTARQHGGTITLTSALGVGSTFCLKLPLYDESNESASVTDDVT